MATLFCVAQGTGANGTISGVVLDPSGARVAHAVVHVTGASVDGSRDLKTDNAGHFSVGVAPGRYGVSIVAEGFDPVLEPDVTVKPDARVDLTFKLQILVQAQQVDAVEENRSGTGAADNKGALVFGQAELASLSDDNATMQKELLALAGSDPMHTPDVYVDGFSGGRFPPKGSIRQIKINQNPYSAEYPTYGQNRMEILSKPGGASFHGDLYAQGNDAPWNANNPYTPLEPPYYSYYVNGDLSGPLGKNTSFASAAYFADQHNNTVVNAVNPATFAALSEAVPNPDVAQNESARIDRQMSPNNTLTARYEFNRETISNAGVGLLVLPSEGSNTATSSQTLQIGDTQVISPKVVSESRFQYLRTRVRQNATDSAPTVVVSGVFNGGGSAVGTQHGDQDRYEFQQYLSFDEGKHFIRAGARYDLLRDANESTANYNGTYTFPDLATYQATLAGAPTGAETQLTIVTGQPSAVVTNGWLGAFAEDEWKARKGLTLDAGLRFETESAIPDHADWAPRLGFAWAIGQRDKKPALLVLRGGFGIFYDRFSSSNILTAVRQNGISQQSYTVTDPAYDPNKAPVPDTGATPVPTSTYSISPRLRSQYTTYSGLTVDHSFGKIGSVSVSYYATRSVHQFLSRNVNAPLPGTYIFGDATSGIYPMGTSQPVFQFASDGISKAQTVSANVNLHPAKRVMLWGFLYDRYENGDSSGAGSFPSNEYNLAQDYGRPPYSDKRLFVGGNVELFWQTSLNMFLGATGRTPFNITTGTDLNGDSQYNDRPSFATDLTRPSVVKTSFGNFDTLPIPGQKIIPINYGTGPALVTLEAQFGKSIAFGPRPAAPAAAKGAPGKPAAKGDAPYTLRFSVEGANVFNHVNPGTPIGVLNSPYFGKSISLQNFFSGNMAANRTISVATAFTF